MDEKNDVLKFNFIVDKSKSSLIFFVSFAYEQFFLTHITCFASICVFNNEHEHALDLR